MDIRDNYSFPREQFRECRRRTFWTTFLVDVSTGEILMTAD